MPVLDARRARGITMPAATADDGCMPCPARALREATRVSAGGAHPTPPRGYACLGWASVDLGRRKSAPV